MLIDAEAQIPVSQIPLASSSSAGAESSTQFNAVAAIGTMADEASTNVTITGGSITGLSKLSVIDTSAAHDVVIAGTSNVALTADRTLTIDIKNASRKLTMSGDADVSGTNTGDQTLAGLVGAMMVLLVSVGDLSQSRRWAWIPTNGCRHMALALGWPAGVIGTLALEVSNHGLTGIPGEPYPVALPRQPAGTAAVAILDDIETNANFITLTFSPGSGNSGAGKLLTDDSGVVGACPTMSMRL